MNQQINKAVEILKAHTTDLMMLAVGTLIALSVAFTSELNPYPEGADAFFYVNAGKNVCEIIKNLPGFLVKFLGNDYTPADYARMGFVDPSGINTIFRAPSYALFLAFVFLCFGASPTTVLISQAVILGLIFMMTYQFLKQHTGRLVSISVTLVSMLHFSYYMGARRANTEPFLALCILVCLKIYSAIAEKPGPKKAFLLGLALVFASMIKSSTQYLYILVAIALLVNWKINGMKFQKKTFGFLLLGIVVPLTMLGFLYTRTNGKTGVMEPGAGGRNIYCGQEYFTDTFYTRDLYQNKWYVEEARKMSGKLDNRMWFVQYSEVCKRALIKTFKNDFFSFAIYTIKKSFWHWAYPPCNIPKPSGLADNFLRGKTVYAVHQLSLALAIVGLLCIRGRIEYKIFLFTLLVYQLGLYGMSNVCTRHFFPMIPFHFITCGFLAGEIKPVFKNRHFLVSAGSFLLAWIISLFPKPYFITDYHAWLVTQVLFVNALALTGAFLLVLHFLNKHSVTHRVIASMYLVYFWLCANIFMMTDKDMLATRTQPTDTITQEIALPTNWNRDNYEQFYLMLDPGIEEINMNISINGVPLTNKVFSSKSPVLYANEKEWSRDEPRWRFAAVPKNLIKQTNVISVSLPKKRSFNADYLSKKIKRLPSYIYYYINLWGIYGYEAQENMEKRVYVDTDLHSTSNTTKIDGRKLRDRRARIYLLAKQKGNYYINKKYAGLDNALPSYLSLLRLTDRGIVTYKLYPGPDDAVISNELPRVIMGEVDNFFSGYELF